VRGEQETWERYLGFHREGFFRQSRKISKLKNSRDHFYQRSLGRKKKDFISKGERNMRDNFVNLGEFRNGRKGIILL